MGYLVFEQNENSFSIKKRKSFLFLRLVTLVAVITLFFAFLFFTYEPKNSNYPKQGTIGYLMLIICFLICILYLVVRYGTKEKDFFFKRHNNEIIMNEKKLEAGSLLELLHVSNRYGTTRYTLRIKTDNRKIVIFYNIDKTIAYTIANNLSSFLNLKLNHLTDSFGVFW